MRRYNVYASRATAGIFEVIKENISPVNIADEDYWAECFTWTEMKIVIPLLRRQGWKVKVDPVERDGVYGKIHVYSFTYGINHDVRIIEHDGMRIILSQDLNLQRPRRTGL